MPVLSRGKHRNPRKGACFMEMASYLAGERWSDHPRCTHPVLAHLARSVNDNVSDVARSRLVEHVPSVIGVTGDDPHVDATVALRAATTAYPLAPHERQRVLAVGILAAERLLASLDGRPLDSMRESTVEVLRRVPDAFRWGRDFGTSSGPPSAKRFRKQSAPTMIRVSTSSLAHCGQGQPDQMLVDLLVAAIGDCRELRGVSRTCPADRALHAPNGALFAK